MIRRASNPSLTLASANALDARAAAGNRNAVRRRKAVMKASRQSGYAAQSATQAAIRGLAQEADAAMSLKQALRADIQDVRDAIDEDFWPVELTVTNAQGEQVTVIVRSKEEAEVLLESLEAQYSTLGHMSEEMTMQLQQAMQSHSQAIQTLSAIMKTQHDTAKAIIDNLRA